MRTGPFASRFAEHGMVCAVDHLAAQAGAQMLQRGGTAADAAIATNAVHAGAIVRRPGVARTLEAIADGGREAFYGGEFGRGLLALGHGEYDASDLTGTNADWVEPLSVDAWGRRLWTVPPNSQGYLSL